MIRLVLFDLDDTLFNTYELIKFARTEALNSMIKLGLDLNLREAIEHLEEVVAAYGSNHPNHFDVLLRRLNYLKPGCLKDVPAAMLIAAAVMAYHRVKVKHLKPYKDVIPTFIRIKKQFGPDIKIGVVTDGVPVKQYEKILRMNLEKFLDVITVSDEIGIRKPNPKLFLYTTRKMGVSPEETLYIGDRIEHDVVPAKGIGIHTVLIHRGGKYDPFLSDRYVAIPEKEPEYHIRKLAEVLDILKIFNDKGESIPQEDSGIGTMENNPT